MCPSSTQLGGNGFRTAWAFTQSALVVEGRIGAAIFACELGKPATILARLVSQICHCCPFGLLRQRRPQGVCGNVSHLRHHVGVGVHGLRDGGVAQLVLDYLGVNVLPE